MYKILAFILLLSLLLTAPLVAQDSKIYKTVDEDGNVIYTDRKPSDDAQPMSLPDLTVADPPAAQPQLATPEQDTESAEISLSFESPQPEEHIHGTANNTLPVRLSTSIDMPRSASIILYLDDEAQEPMRSLSTRIPSIDRGEHTIRAEMVTRGGRVIASTEPVVFYMRQASRQHPTPP